MKKLLTISIPTYNRAELLKICINAIISQIPDSYIEQIELIVSNNASIDNTAAIVSEFQNKWPIIYFENESNLGPDANILKCFEKAKGKYVWIFSDDDILLPGAMPHLLALLEKSDYGTIRLGAVGYHDDITEVDEYYYPSDLSMDVYDDAIQFIEKINYMATFITGIIVNKSVLTKKIDLSEFLGTYLIQLGWVLRIAFAGMQNVDITTKLLACKQDNSGGYKFLTIFSKNYNQVLKKLVVYGLNSRIVDITNLNIIKFYLPENINKILYKKNKSFKEENGFLVLVTTLGAYKAFWKTIFPIYLKFWVKKFIK